MASASDLSNFPSTHGSPVPDDEESPDGTQDQKPAAKRKRENRYKNAPPAVLSVRSLTYPMTSVTTQTNITFFSQRRRAQNRASQRAYRERKDQRIKDLEQMLDDAKQRNDVLSQAYTALHTEYVALKTSQLGDPSYPHQIDLTYGGPANMGMGPGVDGLEMDMFVYNDMQHPAYPY